MSTYCFMFRTWQIVLFKLVHECITTPLSCPILSPGSGFQVAGTSRDTAGDDDVDLNVDDDDSEKYGKPQYPLLLHSYPLLISVICA